MSSSSSHLPENKPMVILSAVLAFLLMCGVFYVRTSQEDPGKILTNENVSKVSVLSKESRLALQKDIDRDGLADWQEMIQGTSIKDADSDDDGVSDGKEVSKNEPRLLGASTNLATTTEGVPTPLSKSDLASRKFFVRFLALRKAGVLNENTGRELATLYAKDVLGAKDKERFSTVYTSKDIVLGKESGRIALISYADKMGQILEDTAITEGPQTELPFFVLALRSQNPAIFRFIEPYAERYREIIRKSLAVPVPREAMEIHLAYLNAMSALLKQVTAMVVFPDTPLESGMIIQRYIEEKEPGVLASLANISRFFKKRNILFEKNIPAHRFTHLLTP